MIPITQFLSIIQSGFQFLGSELTALQLHNLMIIGNGLILGSKFNLSEIHRLWLKKKSVNALSHFLSHGKIRLDHLTVLYHRMLIKSYQEQLKGGKFIIDDTMSHHSKFCKYIHGVFNLFDHSLGSCVKAKCIVFLYYKESGTIMFPIGWRLYSQDGVQTKNELALELIEQSLQRGFPGKVVLADSWFCVCPFIKGLKSLQTKLDLPVPLIYVMEMKSNLTIESALTKEDVEELKQKKKKVPGFEKLKLASYFFNIPSKPVGFSFDLESGKKKRVVYQVQRAVIKMHAFPGKHLVIRSHHVEKKTVKYLITNELTWESTKVIAEYAHRWVIEEFFRNAKQLLDMEGACIRSEQGVAITLFLVSLLDALLHLAVVRRTSKNPRNEPLTVQSIVRLGQLENIENFIEIIQDENRRDGFIEKWVDQLKEDALRFRKKRYELVELESESKDAIKKEFRDVA